MRSMKIQVALILILSALLVMPALAGTKYTDGSPNLTTYLGGANEFSAGDDIQIPVVIENTGLNTYKEVSSNIVSRDDLPNTAKFVWVTMTNGTAPLIIKSDPQMIGDIPGQSRKTVIFSAKVNADAPAGTYAIPLDINYTTFSSVDEYTSSQTFRYRYLVNDAALTVPIVIKAEVIPEVISATPENLVAGADGYLNLTLENTGSLDGTKATVKIQQNDNSPITPVDSSVYIGDFPVGSTVTCQYKVSIDKTAGNKSYPVDVVVVYQNNEGDYVDSRVETVGVNVGSKVAFEIVSPPTTMSPGSKQTVLVEYKNTGDSTIKSAQARISVVDPFTSTNDVAYLGDMAPGESAVASYQISVSRAATLKDYGLDSEIRYRDSLDNTYISDPMKVSISVQNLPGIMGIVTHPVYLSLIVAAVIGIIYSIWYIRKSIAKKKN
ncbi:MAG: S-layer protein [Methanoregula sp.]|nr:S-layer protein [Methanoregula sp.]